MRVMVLLLLILILFGSSACNRAPAPEPYTPGLGEIMSLQQMRHAKLWFAGEAENWELAAYEVDEIGEGFDDVVRFHPTHKDSPVDPKDAVPRMVNQPVADLRAAIEKKDAAAFDAAYDELTAACNSCHKATNFGFNQVQRPAMNPYPNQAFTKPTGG
jgi:cytochrome c553